eukprot:3040458-Rhodomonas_salina.2
MDEEGHAGSGKVVALAGEWESEGAEARCTVICVKEHTINCTPKQWEAVIHRTIGQPEAKQPTGTVNLGSTAAGKIYNSSAPRKQPFQGGFVKRKRLILPTLGVVMDMEKGANCQFPTDPGDVVPHAGRCVFVALLEAVGGHACAEVVDVVILDAERYPAKKPRDGQPRRAENSGLVG